MPGTNLGQAYVQIMPSAKGIGSNLSKTLSGEMNGVGDSIGAGLGKSIGGTLIKGLAALGIGAAVKKLFSEAIQAGAEMQQSFGGLDTIYGSASESMKEMAYQAAQAGISANDYAEQAVSFGASLKQAFGGDATQAAKAANTAIMDMADNAAKMGTDMSSIQNAYQGFAKGNYTMLDNLKLGYGGTQQEMQRLLSDAEKLTGVKYDISNLGDVYEAIHVVQGELGLTGVAAQEGATTFSGSMAAMKAAATNLLANMALGENISGPLTALAESVKNFLVGNLLPMIGNVLKQLPGIIGSALMWAFQNIPNMIDSIIGFLNNLTQGMTDNSGKFKDALVEIGKAAMEMFKNIDWKGLGLAVVTFIGTALQIGGQLIWSALKAIGTKAAEWFRNVDWAGVGRTVINLIVQGLSALGQLIWNGLKQIGQNAWQGFISINWGDLGKSIIAGIINGLSALISNLWNALRNIASNIWKSFTNTDWSVIGNNLVVGIANGINSAGHWIWDTLKAWASNAWENVKNFFRIGSPSKLMRDSVGKWIPLGMAEGIEDEGKAVVQAMNDVAAEATGTIDTDFSYAATTDSMASNATAVPDNIAINIYPAPGMDVRAIADEVERRLAQVQRQKQAAWGMA